MPTNVARALLVAVLILGALGGRALYLRHEAREGSRREVEESLARLPHGAERLLDARLDPHFARDAAAWASGLVAAALLSWQVRRGVLSLGLDVWGPRRIDRARSPRGFWVGAAVWAALALTGLLAPFGGPA